MRRSLIWTILLLVSVVWTAGCDREPAVDPTAAARPTPSPTGVPAVAPSPSPTVVTLATPTPWDREPIDGASYPCGPSHWSYDPYAHSQFLYWGNGTSTLIVDVGEAIWQVDTRGAWVRKIADANPGPDDWKLPFGYHADISPADSRLVYATCEYTVYPEEVHFGTRGPGAAGDPPRRDRGYEIATVNADGTGRRRLTRNVSFEGYPAWSPSGDSIAFIANYVSVGHHRGSGIYESSEARIFTIAADGTDLKVVPNTDPPPRSWPTWRD